MAESCPECGAAVPAGGACRDHFHALLMLEAEIPGGPGGLPHFYAVATYGLQHPISMNYTVEALGGLHAAVADVLDGHTSMGEHLRRTRRAVDGAVRVTRRAGDRQPEGRPVVWPMTVTDVLSVEPIASAYAERVTRWARLVRETLDGE